MKKLIIIDGNSLVNRAFYALPPLTASDGTPSQAVYGFATMLVKLIVEQTPDYFAVAFDTRAPTFRHKAFEGYKATRKGMPDELAAQLAPLKKMLKLMNIRTLECEGFEADDIIGTVSKHCCVECLIVTGDKDSLQLVDDNVSVMLTKRGITEVLLVTKDNFEKEIGLKPEQIVDYKALSGDSSDNIPGVAGIGDKTATSLLTQFETLNGIYENIDSIQGAVKNKLIAGKDSAYLSQELATINTCMELDCIAQGFTYDFPFSHEVKDYFKFLGFRSLLKRDELFSGGNIADGNTSGNAGENVGGNIGGNTGGNTSKNIGGNAGGNIGKNIGKNIGGNTVVPNFLPAKKKIKTVKIHDIALLTQILSRPFDTLSFYYDENLYFTTDKETSYEVVTAVDLLGAGIDYHSAIKLFFGAFEDIAVKKLVFDAKALKKKLKKQGIELKNYEDIKLMQYLVDMTADYSAAKKLLDFYDCADGGALAMRNIYDDLSSELKRLEMEKLYYEIELPLIEVLFDMEETGFRIDTNKIESLGKVFSAKMRELTERIHCISGCEFNINSPKQLADVLFNKMQIPYPTKSKNYSTNADILQEIAGKHEIIDCILEYRTYFKLNNTYVEGLKKLAVATDIIHTEFKQMVTSTGRLSSVEPNLQNIPIRDEEGKVLREIFISGQNKTLVSADYSQIELRLMAHYSKDEKLMAAYKCNEDIHTSTASEVFGVKKNEVTYQMRRDAKAVNFGIIYGISDFGLAKNLKIPRYQAKNYIEKYFERFSSVKKYLDESVRKAKETGYAETLLGRKRKIPELYSSNYNIRSFGERAAMNMPLQGTAADIVKIAMLKVYKALEGKKSKLILQIHDELIVEAHDDELEEVKILLRENMTQALKLRVPLEVDISSGKRWSDC